MGVAMPAHFQRSQNVHVDSPKCFRLHCNWFEGWHTSWPTQRIVVISPTKLLFCFFVATCYTFFGFCSYIIITTRPVISFPNELHAFIATSISRFQPVVPTVIYPPWYKESLVFKVVIWIELSWCWWNASKILLRSPHLTTCKPFL